MTQETVTESAIESNTEPINFRVPRSLKEQLKVMAEYEMVSSIGELLRDLAREHINRLTNTQAYRDWMRKRERRISKAT